MNLSDIRKFAIRRQAQVRFSLSGGMACVIDRHGVARVPGLDRPPAFNLEEELEKARDFVVETAAGPKGKPVSRTLRRDELESQAGAAPVAARDDHEE